MTRGHREFILGSASSGRIALDTNWVTDTRSDHRILLDEKIVERIAQSCRPSTSTQPQVQQPGQPSKRQQKRQLQQQRQQQQQQQQPQQQQQGPGSKRNATTQQPLPVVQPTPQLQPSGGTNKAWKSTHTIQDFDAARTALAAEKGPKAPNGKPWCVLHHKLGGCHKGTKCNFAHDA